MDFGVLRHTFSTMCIILECRVLGILICWIGDSKHERDVKINLTKWFFCVRFLLLLSVILYFVFVIVVAVVVLFCVSVFYISVCLAYIPTDYRIPQSCEYSNGFTHTGTSTDILHT